MHTKSSTIITALVIMVGMAIPIALSAYLARTGAVEAEKSFALTYANDVLARSEAVLRQVDTGFRKLDQSNAGAPCSPAHRALMKQVDLASSFIQAVGYVEGKTILCSTLGAEFPPIDLGAVDLARANGVNLRFNVVFPFAPGSRFLTVERHGYVAIVHKDLPINATANTPGVALATFAYPELRVITANGLAKPEWIKSATTSNRTFIDSDYVVATVTSKHYPIGALCAIPIANLDQRTRASLKTLIPAGLLGSLLFAWAVLYVSKLRTSMPSIIKGALKRKEFFLEYQPLVELSTGKWVGAEVLIRWRRTQGEFIRPDTFVPVAEENGLIQKVTEYVLDRVATDTAELFRRHPEFHLGINLSSADLHDEATVSMLLRMAAATHARHTNFIVEATESSFTDYGLASVVINRLREEGFAVAIDDFGTGYSSLSYLQRIRLDYLKIDKSFVAALDTSAATSDVTLHIIEMAKSLKLQMIAEGVETEAQARFLRQKGVQYAQGWLFARPMALPELMRQLEERAAAELTAP
jgi:sensor c-di-GMP phosphodiesterase-like protein